MIFRIRIRALSLLLPLLSPLGVAAQEAADLELIQQQSDRLIQQQEQLLSEQQRERQRQQTRTSIDAPALPPPPPQPDPAGLCFDIDKIEVDGVSDPFAGDIDRAVSGYLGECLSLYSINSLLRQITLLYLEQGYITTRAYLPQQNLSHGALKIQVIEGVVEQIDQSSAPGINIQTAFPGVSGQHLNLRDIEQGLDQLNRLAANQVVMELVPGSTAGASIMRLTNQPKRRWQASLRHDNSGQPATGERQNRVKVSLDDPFGLNDYISLTAQGTATLKPDGEGSQNLSLRYELPYGYWMYAFDATWFDYESRVQGLTESFDTSGKSSNLSLTASRVIARDRNSKSELLASLTRKSSKNYVEDVLLESSSRVLGVGMLEGRYRHYFSGHRSLGFALGYKRGLPIFTDVDGTAGDGPEAEYDAFFLNLDLSAQIPGVAHIGRYLGTLAMQYSEDILYGSEQFSIGGQYTVRGFREENLAGSRGMLWRNEYFEPVPVAQNDLGLRWVTPFLAYDFGAVESEPRDGDWQTLSGISAGLQLSGRHFHTDVTFARAIQRPSTFSADKHQLYFSVTLNL